MKTNTLLVVTVILLVLIIAYLFFTSSTKTTVSHEYVPLIYKPRDTLLVGNWGFPTKPWFGGQRHPPPPSPPAPPAPPAPSAPPAPPAPPATFVDMSKNVEGFFSPASYPFA